MSISYDDFDERSTEDFLVEAKEKIKSKIRKNIVEKLMLYFTVLQSLANNPSEDMIIELRDNENLDEEDEQIEELLTQENVVNEQEYKSLVYYSLQHKALKLSAFFQSNFIGKFEALVMEQKTTILEFYKSIKQEALAKIRQCQIKYLSHTQKKRFSSKIEGKKTIQDLYEVLLLDLAYVTQSMRNIPSMLQKQYQRNDRLISMRLKFYRQIRAKVLQRKYPHNRSLSNKLSVKYGQLTIKSYSKPKDKQNERENSIKFHKRRQPMKSKTYTSSSYIKKPLPPLKLFRPIIKINL